MALTLLGLGMLGAFTSGLVGVGGAVVMIPLLLYVPPLLSVGILDIKIVTGLTMTQVLAAAVVGTWSHGRHAHVHRALAWTGGPSMAVCALVGAIASRYVSGHALLVVFALMATMALPLMAVTPVAPSPDARDEAVPFSRAAAVVYPGVIGLMSGLVGAGGAFLLVPALVGLMRIPMRLSIGTSLAMVSMSAATGFVGKAATGQVPLWASIVLVLGSLAGAPLGARVSRRMPVGALRAVLVALIVVVMLRVWIDVFRF
jgi:uncharacterized membrane protein YfcA